MTLSDELAMELEEYMPEDVIINARAYKWDNSDNTIKYASVSSLLLPFVKSFSTLKSLLFSIISFISLIYMSLGGYNMSAKKKIEKELEKENIIKEIKKAQADVITADHLINLHLYLLDMQVYLLFYFLLLNLFLH